MPKYVYTDISKMKNGFILISIIALIAGYLIGNLSASPEIRVIPASYISQATINLPAIDQDGNGVATPLKVELRTGNGKVLTNIDKLLFWIDTQYSIQTSKSVAESYTGIEADKFDLTYTIEGGNVTLIEGPSAGAALTIATIAALQNKTLRPNVMITGTINPDGTIGQVGSIIEKATAAKETGATIFLVPSGESVLTYLKPEENCTTLGTFYYCRTEYKEVSLNVEKETGIKVVEVSNINQAISYFL